MQRIILERKPKTEIPNRVAMAGIPKTKKPEYFFSLLILFFGILSLFIIPIGAGTDEETHIGRIWEMSSGEFLPNRNLSSGPNYPCVFFETSYYNDPFYTPITWEKWGSLSKARIDWNSFCDLPTRARYFPTLYLFQAAIMGFLGRVLDSPIVYIYYLIRISYILIYSILSYFIIKVIPFGKWLFGVLLISPMTLIQASTVNPDSINNGISLAFIAWVIYLFSVKNEEMSKKNWVITIVLIISLCTVKPNSLPLLFLFAILPGKMFGNKKRFVAFIIVIILSVLIISIGWNYLTSANLLDTNTEETLSVVDQIRFLISNPSHLPKSLSFTLQNQSGNYLRDWIGATGYNFWGLPWVIYFVYIATLISCFFVETSNGTLRTKQKLIIFSVFLLGFFSTIMVFYILYNQPTRLDIPGIQGRYFIFVIPLLLILFIPTRQVINISTNIPKLGIILTGIMFVVALFLVYHVNCGNSYFSLEKCYLPRYRNWSPATGQIYEIVKHEKISQTFTPRCTNLSSIQLWLEKDASSREELSLLLKNKDGSIIDLNNVSIQHSDNDQEFITYSFDPTPNLKNRELVIEIIPDDNNLGLNLIFSGIDEYKDGQLFINNLAVNRDLLFKYGCDIGWDSLIN